MPHISSSGRGEVRVAPDHAVITAIVEARSDTASVAAAENVRRYGALVTALQAAGVQAQQISSAGYTVTAGAGGAAFAVSPDGATPMITGSARPPARSSALARRTLRVDLVRTNDVDRVVAAALNGGATQIGVQFAAPSLASAQQAALIAAVAEARANADAMARGAGGTLGRLVDLSPGFSPFGSITSYVSATPYEGSPFGGVGMPPTVRDLAVVATVSGRWEIVMPPAARGP